MYLGPALKIAIPFAILDREDMARVYGDTGPAAEEANKACADLRRLKGIKASKYTASQKETARLALCWAEQYLFGYIDALNAKVDKDEVRAMTKQMEHVRAVRLHHFGFTANEASSMRATAVPIGGDEHQEALLKLLGSSVLKCTACPTQTNMRKVGDTCTTCNIGTFQAAQPPKNR
ncbi:hypothetical protein [Comamonas testosteroni]|uniref:hypothetical protein n=1 Tax=Comamonas testosteroni TaxID=285 RepID=UPI0012D343E1|nr:hypothetical protein [Comamonas testosteroni]